MQLTSNNNYSSHRKNNLHLILKNTLPLHIEHVCSSILNGDLPQNIKTLSVGRDVIYLLPIDTEHKLLIKIYTHGGLFSFFKYWFLTNRCLNEFNLFTRILDNNLPVPEYLGIFWIKKHVFYKCGVITQYIPDAYTLEEFLISDSISNDEKQNISLKTGEIIKRMHRLGVYHKDLQTRNILIDSKSNSVFLIDFDKAMTKKNLNNFHRSFNLIRLKRSFIKRNIPLHFYNTLLKGYGDVTFSFLANLLASPHLTWVSIKTLIKKHITF